MLDTEADGNGIESIDNIWQAMSSFYGKQCTGDRFNKLLTEFIMTYVSLLTTLTLMLSLHLD